MFNRIIAASHVIFRRFEILETRKFRSESFCL